jgi:hypothetical protein
VRTDRRAAVALDAELRCSGGGGAVADPRLKACAGRLRLTRLGGG